MAATIIIGTKSTIDFSGIVSVIVNSSQFQCKAHFLHYWIDGNLQKEHAGSSLE